jgi:hypothetical protein
VLLLAVDKKPLAVLARIIVEIANRHDYPMPLVLVLRPAIHLARCIIRIGERDAMPADEMLRTVKIRKHGSMNVRNASRPVP